LVIGYWALVISSASAQVKDLTINADKVSYDKARYRVEATGSVEVDYQDIKLTGNHLIYNSSAETFHADQGFTFVYDGALTFEGETLDYELVSRDGTAEGANFLYQGVYLGGRQLNFNEERFEIKNAHFTTCDLPQPHYHITAADLQLYPKERWMVSYWGIFWLGRVPVAVMPTYIYDFTGTRQQTPFPDFGSNGDDGNYLTETLAWNLNRQLNGTYSISYLSNKGLGLGGTANYIANDNNKGDVRINWNGKDGSYGGITHVYSFGTLACPAPQTPLDLALLPCQNQYELQATLSSRERINYQRVSFLPDLDFLSRGAPLGNTPVKYDYELDAARVNEENNVFLKRGGGKFRLYEDLPELAVGSLTPSLVWDSMYYSNSTHWLKPSVGLSDTKVFTRDLALGLDYTHFLAIDGQSPFLYENYRYRAADTLGSSLLLKIGETKARIAAVYYLDNWSPEDIDYTLFFILHCYNLEVTYRSLRSEFLLGFSLAAR